MKNFWRTLKYLKPYRLLILLSVGCMLGYVIFSAFSITLVMPFLDAIFETNISQMAKTTAPKTSSLQSQGIVGKFEGKLNGLRAKLTMTVDHFFRGSSKEKILTRLCSLLFLGFFLKNIFGFFQVFWASMIEQNVLHDLRRDLFKHIQSIHLDFYHKEKVGNLVSRVTNDVAIINYSITSILNSFSRDPFLLALYFLIMFILSWKLTLFSLVVIPVFGYMMVLIGDAIRKYTVRSQLRMADMASILFESLSGIRVIKAFGSEQHMLNRFMLESDKNRIAMAKRAWASGVSSPINELLGVITGICILWFGGNEVIRGNTDLTGGGFMLFLFAMFSTIQPLKNIGQLWTNTRQGMSAAERVFQIMDIQPIIRNRQSAKKVEQLSDSIRFENVWYGYESDRFVLKNINGKIPKGKVVAIVGPSGSGKSTLADLILRFYDPQKGNIFLDDINLREVDLSSLRKLVGVVTQDTILFHDSVQNNIAFGYESLSLQKLEEATKAANAYDFIRLMPEGFNTIIGDRGAKISGGQRQRLAIARAILRDPPILILDEATSSLDTESERLVQESISKLMKNRTVLLIAHRLSTIKDADEIWVMEKGETLCRGKHDALLKTCDLYQKLYSNQFLENPLTTSEV